MATDANKIRIMVIDDQAVVRQGFVSLIKTVPDMEIVGEGSNGQEAVVLFRQLRPDITLMDLRMPSLSGAEAIKQIRLEFPAARIIVLTTFGRRRRYLPGRAGGAQGYLC